MRNERHFVFVGASSALWGRGWPACLMTGALLAFVSGCSALRTVAEQAPLPSRPSVAQVTGATKEWSNALGVFYSPNISYSIDVTIGFGNLLEVSSEGVPVPRIDINDPVMDSTEPPENSLVSRNGVYRATELLNDIATKRQILRLEFFPRTWPQWRSNPTLAHARPFELTLVERSIHPDVANTSAALSAPNQIILMTWKTPCSIDTPQFSPSFPRVREPVTITYSARDCKSVTASSTDSLFRESLASGPSQNFNETLGSWVGGFNGDQIRVIISGMNAAGVSAAQVISGVTVFDPPPPPPGP